LELEPTSLDPRLAELVPVEFARGHQVLPIGAGRARLTVAMDDPTDAAVIAELHQRTGCAIEVVTSTRASIRDAIASFYRVSGASVPALAAVGHAAEVDGRQWPAARGEGPPPPPETSMGPSEIEAALLQLQARYTTLVREHETAMRALREQERHFQLLVRERREFVERLERLAPRLRD
jgi:hypothetical protein